MKLKILDVREVNWTAKQTNIEYANKEKKEGYKFTSTCDECNYVYPHDNLYDAIRKYEIETAWIGITAIEYTTRNKNIEEEYKIIKKLI